MVRYLLAIVVFAGLPLLSWAALAPNVRIERVTGTYFPIENMRTDGFAILPPGSVLSEAEQSTMLNRINAAMEGPNKQYFLRVPVDPSAPVDARREAVMESFHQFQERVQGRLHAVLPEEIPRLSAAAADVLTDYPAPVEHVDVVGYLGAHIALGDLPMIIYRVLYDGAGAPSAVEEIHSPTGSTVVVTRPQRMLAVGVPSTIHVSPARGPGRRIATLDYGDYQGSSMISGVPEKLHQELTLVRNALQSERR